MNRDRINFIWFILAGIAVVGIIFVHPFTIIQAVSFGLLAGFFFYLAWQSFQFDRKDSEYGHTTGVEIPQFVSKLIRSAAMAIPALLLAYMLAFFGLQMAFKPGPLTNPAAIGFTRLERGVFGQHCGCQFAFNLSKKVMVDMQAASAAGNDEAVFKGIEFLRQYVGLRFSYATPTLTSNRSK